MITWSYVNKWRHNVELTAHWGHVIAPVPRCTLPSWFTHTEQNECPHPRSSGTRSTCWRPSPEQRIAPRDAIRLQATTHPWQCRDGNSYNTGVPWNASYRLEQANVIKTFAPTLRTKILQNPQCNYKYIIIYLNTSNYIIIKFYLQLLFCLAYGQFIINNILSGQSCNCVSRSFKWVL